MTDPDPRQPNESRDPANQTGEDKGRIKQSQQGDGLAEKNVPRGSEREAHARK